MLWQKIVFALAIKGGVSDHGGDGACDFVDGRLRGRGWQLFGAGKWLTPVEAEASGAWRNAGSFFAPGSVKTGCLDAYLFSERSLATRRDSVNSGNSATEKTGSIPVSFDAAISAM